MFCFSALCAAFAAIAARCPAYANFFASAVTLIATAGWDPQNFAGGGVSRGAVVEASVDLAGYGALPFIAGSLIVPRIEVLLFAVLGHTVRRTALRSMRASYSHAVNVMEICATQIRAFICLYSTTAALVFIVGCMG